jgi:MoxR-like ATPase
MGRLLSVNLTVTHCANATTPWCLFGTTAESTNVENGSKLNNFLTENSGKGSVAFLDEFDKTGSEVRNSLLLITENGE